MTVTPRKIEANRRNAQKSTGPKTAAGRAASKMNALKHGMLAETVVVSGHKLRESTQDFKKLCAEFYAELQPVGALEEMLVDQIVTSTWRLRRARTAETGEIALSVDEGWWRRDNDNSLTVLLAMPPLSSTERLIRKLQETEMGCHFLIHCLKEVRQAVVRDREVTESTVSLLNKWLRDQADDWGIKLEEFRKWLRDNPEKLAPEALRQRHQEAVLNYLDEKIRGLEFRMQRCHEREAAQERSRQAAAVLPSAATLDKILRYESALERQIYRAIHELERAQRRRLGEVVPAPLAVEVSAKG